MRPGKHEEARLSLATASLPTDGGTRSQVLKRVALAFGKVLASELMRNAAIDLQRIATRTGLVEPAVVPVLIVKEDKQCR